MPLIYRLESKCGTGVYRHCFDVANENHNMYVTPSPSNDTLLEDFWNSLTGWSKYYFGFASVDQMKQWFYDTEQVKRLHDENIVVVIYETDDAQIKVGSKQAIFVKKASKLVDKHELHVYYPEIDAPEPIILRERKSSDIRDYKKQTQFYSAVNNFAIDSVEEYDISFIISKETFEKESSYV